MEKDTQQNTLGAQTVRKLFDQTLGQHIERLIGAKYGIGALPVNLATISCLILLAEREAEIQNLPSTPSERYTHKTLTNELTEIGLDPDEDLSVAVQDMIQRGYIDVDDDGKFSAKKPTITMAQLLDRAFPKMPGMNLIAYFVQTMDEVQSGRKDLDSAISQFDQILQMQGVSLVKGKTRPKPEKAPRPSVERETKLRKIETPRAPRSEPRILSLNGNSGPFERREVEVRGLSAWQDDSPETFSEVDEVIEAQAPDIIEEAEEEEIGGEAETEDLASETVRADTSLEDAPFTQEEPLPLSKPVEQETGLSENVETEREEAVPRQPEDAFEPAETEIDTEAVPKEHALEGADDIVEERIATFEEDLAMQCPICRNAKVITEKTATGKLYYKCSDKNCNLISWGKPYHLVCPQCKNPFLVETSDREGKTMLKCPRATCHYWQRPPWEIPDEPQEKAVSQDQESVKPSTVSRKPRKRVVRRRVVRRKR